MTFGGIQINLDGSRKDTHPLKQCSNGHTASPGGGIQLSPTKWLCATCWARRASRRKN
jgi:hypothetical protein